MRGLVGTTLVVLISGGCFATGPAGDYLPGTYSLISIDGETLQARLDRDGWGMQSAVMRIQPEGQFLETVIVIRPPGYEPHVVEDTFHGEWSDEGSRYAFHWLDARHFPMVGTLSRRTLTLRTDAGAEDVYQR